MPSNRIETTKQPGLFVAHGAPDVILSDIQARTFLAELGPRLPTPRGIVVVSAHWQTNDLRRRMPLLIRMPWPRPETIGFNEICCVDQLNPPPEIA